MNGRTIFVLLAMSLSPTLAACGGDDAPAPQQSSTLKLDGVYRPVTSGAIASVTFSNDKDYFLVPTGCSDGGCVDIGTYRIDTRASTVILENGTTHRERAIMLEEVKTSDVAVALVKTFVGTRDLLEPGQQLVQPGQQTTNGQQQVTGDQQQLNDGQSKLAEQVGELIKTIMEALMNGQGMKKDDEKKEEPKDEPEDEDKPKPPPNDCKQGVPTNDAPQAEKDAYFARCPGGP